jgi:hypothetical protein
MRANDTINRTLPFTPIFLVAVLNVKPWLRGLFCAIITAPFIIRRLGGIPSVQSNLLARLFTHSMDTTGQELQGISVTVCKDFTASV